MEFTSFEIQLAKRMKRLGVTWTPLCGDWYYSEGGYCDFVRHEKEFPTLGKRVWLPLWEDCRHWLRTHGWVQLEFLVDGEDLVEIEITHATRGPQIARGKSDRECLYKLICRSLEES